MSSGTQIHARRPRIFDRIDPFALRRVERPLAARIEARLRGGAAADDPDSTFLLCRKPAAAAT